MTNKFGIAKTTTLYSAGGQTIPFPSGFNAGNCMIISTMVYQNGFWFHDGDGATRSCGFDGNSIYCYQNGDYDFPGCAYWVILMRID